jgi:hypothetical protein
MGLTDLLRDRKDAVVGRWLEGALAIYSADAARMFSREKDPFANPVGHRLRVGTRGIVDGLLNGNDHGEISSQLEEIIRVRAVQEMDPSCAVGFVFGLKDAIRAELGDELGTVAVQQELFDLERGIDEIALVAFDIFARCRERLCELRINEVKRQVSWVMERQNR